MFSAISLYILNTLLFLNCVVFISCQSINFVINFDNPCLNGECIPLRNCSEAIDVLLKGEFPSICSLKGPSREPIVCCESPEKRAYEDPILPIRNIPSISEQKCEEYSKIRVNQVHTIEDRVTALVGEYPHMAIIGYGNEKNIAWQCAGSLISERYVLTAAHCLYSREYGSAQYVRIGDLNLKNKNDGSTPQNFYVEETIQHPDYRSPLLYHDIALIKLNRDVLFNNIRPACLGADYVVENQNATATGWGTTGFNEVTRHDLVKVSLEVLSQRQCNRFYQNIAYKRSLPSGILNSYQICAGGFDSETDICQGDTGGPLQILDEMTRRKIYIVGITAAGKSCGIANVPGIYTRLFTYIPWIESVVWST